MTAYDTWSAIAVGWLTLLAILLAIPVAWSTIHATRWLINHAGTRVLASIHPIHDDEEPWAPDDTSEDHWWKAIR